MLNFLNQGLEYLIPMIILLGLLIFVHELGHFLAAKFYKVRVEVFSLGFGSKLVKFIYKGTLYCISAIPLGGYVRMYGDEPGKEIPEALKNQSYLHKPVGQRIVIVLAGPLMNLFFAAFLFALIALLGDKVLKPEVGEISLNSQAFKMGFRPYDQILKIDDEPIETWSEVQEIIESSPDQKLSFNLNRGGKEVLVRAKPLSSENDNVFSTAQRIGKIKGLNAYLHIPVIGVIPHGNMARLGFKTGDHIIEINGQPITWFKEIEPRILEELFKGKGQVSLKLKRYPDFRKKEVFKDLSLSLNKESLRGEKLDIFIPETVIAEVEEESPAALGGLQRLDQIKSINGHPIFSFNDIVTHISAYKQGNPPLKIKVLRGTREKSFEIIPQMNQLEGAFGQIQQRFTVGVHPTLFASPQTYIWKSTNFFQLVKRSIQQTWHWSKVTMLSFLRILQARISTKNVSGILSIGQVAQQSWSLGVSAFLKIMAIISINLFVLNLLPIPVLDGGHLLIFTLEAIKGAPLRLRTIQVAQQVGFLIILFLMAFSLFNDFSRLLGS